MPVSPSPATLLRIATANQQLVQILQDLYRGSVKSSDPEVSQQVSAYVGPTLDLTGTISAALNPPESNLLVIASANQQIISQTQNLYYRLTQSSDSQFMALAESYISKVLDLTQQISAAISGP